MAPVNCNSSALLLHRGFIGADYLLVDFYDQDPSNVLVSARISISVSRDGIIDSRDTLDWSFTHSFKSHTSDCELNKF